VRRFAPVVLICATAAGAPAALQISSTTAPAGGFAQIAIYAVKPMAISNGHMVLSLDATAFGAGAVVGLFGANGDASGLATTTGAQIDVQFSSPSSGIGQLAGLPVVVLSVPVLASAAGKTVAVSATSPDSSVTVGSGSVTLQGTLSVGKIPAGMGVVPPGTVVPITGTGFTSSTTVSIDAVVISSTQFVSSTEIEVTIAGAAELVGKLARVTDGGVEFDYFCFQPGDPVNLASPSYLTSVQPLFPLTAANGFSGVYNGVGGVVEVENPNETAATVNFSTLNIYGSGQAAAPVSIPPGGWRVFTGEDRGSLIMVSNLPVRAVFLAYCSPGVGLPVCLSPLKAFDNATENPAPVVTPSSLSFAWQIGSSILPASRTIAVTAPALGNSRYTVTSGGSWLSVSQSNGLISVNPAGLTLGTYQGSILISQNGLSSTALPVTLTVTDMAVPVISANPASFSFNVPFSTAPYSQTIAVTSDSGPAPFTVMTSQPQGAWMTISPLNGTTPATLTVSWDASLISAYAPIQRPLSASIVISGLANTVTIPATFAVTGLQIAPTALVFSQIGSGSQTQEIALWPEEVISATVNQPWISVTTPSTYLGQAFVTVNSAGLPAGVYTGAVTITGAGIAGITVPVTFNVSSAAVNPPPPAITPGNFLFTAILGEPPPGFRYGQVNTGDATAPLTFSGGASWLYVGTGNGVLTPATIRVEPSNQLQLPPGEYDSSFTIQSPGGSINVPVTLLVEPGPVTPPVVSQVVNAASGIPGPVAAGEIVSVRGYGVGASLVSGLRLDPSGMPATALNGLQVTFDGIAAGLVYTSANQTNLMVPAGVAGKSSTVMQITNGTLKTQAWTLPVAPVAPGMFTVDATGTGQGAIVNQDGTVNSAANPAARGSVVSIYMTGQGGASPTLMGILPTNVAVTFGGIAAVVQYAGQAPGEIAGLTQVNAVVPQGAVAGPAVPLVVGFGGAQSQAAVTIAVK
jgi:uncharacterized protein (TIGR03437 family)